MADPVVFQVYTRGLGYGIVVTHDLDTPAVARPPFLGHYNPVGWLFLSTKPGQSNSQHLSSISPVRTNFSYLWGGPLPDIAIPAYRPPMGGILNLLRRLPSIAPIFPPIFPPIRPLVRLFIMRLASPYCLRSWFTS